MAGGNCLVLGNDRHDPFLYDGFEQGFLVRVVEIERALGDARLGGDIFQSGGRKAPGYEKFERSRKQLGRSGFFAAFAGGGGDWHG